MKIILTLLIIASLGSVEYVTCCTYEYNMDYRGILANIDLEWAASTTQEMCCDLCNRNSQCNAWTFVTETKVCWLKKSIGTKVATSGRVSGVKGSTNPANNQECSIEFGYVHPGSDISQPVTVSSQSDCCARCRSTSGCVAWDFLPGYRYCYLKSTFHTTANRRAYTGAFAGILVSTNVVTNAPVTTTCRVTSGYIYPGFDISGSSLNTPTQCCDLCGRTAGCVAWDYLNDQHYCWLKSSLPSPSRRVAYLNSYSGIKN